MKKASCPDKWGRSNLKAVLDAIDSGQLSAQVVGVVSSNYQAGGLEHAKIKAFLPLYVRYLVLVAGTNATKEIIKIAKS